MTRNRMASYCSYYMLISMFNLFICVYNYVYFYGGHVFKNIPLTDMSAGMIGCDRILMFKLMLVMVSNVPLTDINAGVTMMSSLCSYVHIDVRNVYRMPH